MGIETSMLCCWENLFVTLIAKLMVKNYVRFNLKVFPAAVQVDQAFLSKQIL